MPQSGDNLLLVGDLSGNVVVYFAEVYNVTPMLQNSADEFDAATLCSSFMHALPSELAALHTDVLPPSPDDSEQSSSLHDLVAMLVASSPDYEIQPNDKGDRDDLSTTPYDTSSSNAGERGT